MMLVQSCCFAFEIYCFFDVLVAVASLDLKVPVNINKVKGSARDNEKEEISSFPSLLALSLLTLPAFRPPRDDWGRAIVLLVVVENDVQ